MAAALAAVMVVLAPATHAHAAPDPATIEKQIDAAWAELEPLIEQYNKLHAQLADNRAKAATLDKQLAPLRAQVEQAMAGLSGIATRMYKTGPTSNLNALLTTGSPTTLVDQLTTLNHLARHQRAQISGVVALRDQYDAQKRQLDDVVAQQTRQDADLAAKKADIEKRIAELQTLRQQAYGSGAGTGVLRPVACPVDYLGGPGGTAAKAACGFIGKPYVWASAGPGGYDCSGLTKASWATAGVSLRHYTSWQFSDTTPISRADLRPGDLVFFYSDLHHMGLYVGAGWMVHAPTFGDQVRMAKIDGYPIAGYRRPG